MTAARDGPSFRDLFAAASPVPSGSPTSCPPQGTAWHWSL